MKQNCWLAAAATALATGLLTAFAHAAPLTGSGIEAKSPAGDIAPQKVRWDRYQYGYYLYGHYPRRYYRDYGYRERRYRYYYGYGPGPGLYDTPYRYYRWWW
jgi:hypothetical protein